MSTPATSSRLDTLKWSLRKLVGLFVVYVGVGSIYKSIVADSVIAALLYTVLAAVGIYLIANW